MVRFNVHDPPVSALKAKLPCLAGHPGELRRLLQEDCSRLQELEEVCDAVWLLLQQPDPPLAFPCLAEVRREAERREVRVAILGRDARLRNQLLRRTAEGGSAVLGVSGHDCPPLRLHWADFFSRPACLDRFALVVLTASARAFAARQERALEIQTGLLTSGSQPALLLLLKNDDEASVEPARRRARELGVPQDCVFFESGPGPAEALLNAVHTFQRERLNRLFDKVNKWARPFMTRQRNRLGKAQSRENEAGQKIDRLCARTDHLENAFQIRRSRWVAGQWRRMDGLLKNLLKHLREERAVFWRLANFQNDARIPRGDHSEPQRLAREIAVFWSARLREEVERWDGEEGGSRIQDHLQASRAACLTEVFDSIPASQRPHNELEAALEAEVFAPSAPAPAPVLLRLGCSLEAAFSQSTWDLQALAPRDSAATVERYRSERAQALQRYLLYWRQYCLDLQLLRSFLLSMQPHLNPQGLARRLGGLKQRAVDLLSREVGGELTHFHRLEDLTREQQQAFHSACNVISLVNLFHARHLRHDSFRREDFPRFPDAQPTGPYLYHHGLRLTSLQGEMASLKMRADPVSQSNVLDLYTELKAWQQLSLEGFQGIAHLYGTVTLSGRLSFVFEACDGRLSDLLRADRSLVPHLQTSPAARLRALQQLCRFARQLFSATFFLHRRRFVHRDLATETILYNHGDWTYELKLCNFTVSGTNTDVFDTMTNLSWYDTTLHGQKLALSPALDMCNLGLVLWEIYHGEPVAPQPIRGERSLIPAFEAFDGPAPLRDLIFRLTSRDEGLRPTEADEADILQLLRSREALGARRRLEES